MNGYEVWLIIERSTGRQSAHWAKSKEEGAIAHVAHWGLEEVYESQIQAFSMVDNDIICREKYCLDAVNMPRDIRNAIFSE
jgi:hypothetical protein